MRALFEELEPTPGRWRRAGRVGLITALGAGATAAMQITNPLGTVVIAPNCTSPGPYMAAIFAGTLPMAYIGEGGGILSYLAIGGTAFVIGYGGPGPRADVLDSIWSIWGISLGMIIRAVVSLLWREQANRTLAEQFQPPLAAMLDLLEESGGFDGKRRRVAAEMATVAGIATMLTVANDAVLEGRGAKIDGNQLVNALDTLRRLAFEIGNLARLRPAASGVSTAERAAERAALTDAIRVRLQSWLCSLHDQTDSGVVSHAPLRKMVAEAKAPEMHLLLDEDSRVALRVGYIVRLGSEAHNPADANVGVPTGCGLAQLKDSV